MYDWLVNQKYWCAQNIPQPLTQGLSQTLIEAAQKPLKVSIIQGAIVYFSQHTPFFQTLIPVD